MAAVLTDKAMSILPPNEPGQWHAEFNDYDSGYWQNWWTAVLVAVEHSMDGTPVDIESAVWVRRDGEMYLVTYEDAIKANTEHLLKR